MLLTWMGQSFLSAGLESGCLAFPLKGTPGDSTSSKGSRQDVGYAGCPLPCSAGSPHSCPRGPSVPEGGELSTRLGLASRHILRAPKSLSSLCMAVLTGAPGAQEGFK